MKVRNGFVSNSSTQSFIIDLEACNNVFELTKKIIRIIIDDKYGDLCLDRQDKREFRLYLKRISNLESKSIDKHTPVIFPTYNFDTYIVKKNDGYYVNTDHVLPWDSFLNPKQMDFDHCYDFISEGYRFYILVYDVLGKIIDNPENIPCKNHPYPYNNVELTNGKIVCLECEKRKGNLNEFQISNIEDPNDTHNRSVKFSSNEENDMILAKFKYLFNEIRKRKPLEEKQWMELYSWGLQIFSEEITKSTPNFECVSEVSSFLIEIGIEQNNLKIVSLGKNLLACSLSFSKEIKDLEYSVSLFDEIKFRIPDFYSGEYHRKAVNGVLNAMKNNK